MKTAIHKLPMPMAALLALLVSAFRLCGQDGAASAGAAAPADVASSAAAGDAVAESVNSRLIAAWSMGETEAGEAVPMEGLSFPIDHFDDGTVRAQFSAEWALIPNDPAAFVRAKGVCIELYDEQGAVQGIYVADNCIFDRATKIGYCEGPVRMEYQAPGRSIRLDGRGMQWNLATRDAKILAEPKLVMSEIMGELGGAFR